LLLSTTASCSAGLGAEADRLHSYRPAGAGAIRHRALKGRILSLRVRNDENGRLLLRQGDGEAGGRSFLSKSSGYNHNMADGFMSLRPALFVRATA